MANTFKIDTKSSVSNSGTSNSNTNVVTAGGSATLVLLSCLVSKLLVHIIISVPAIICLLIYVMKF